MAKKPRMGRNLNALLNSGGRERSNVPGTSPDGPSATDRPVTDGSATNKVTTDAPAIDEQGTSGAKNSSGAPGVPMAPDASSDPSGGGNSLPPNAARVDAAAPLPGPGGLHMIGIERIRRGVYQPRRVFDPVALQELADSLKSQGMIQPIIVREFGGAYELIAGERRWRAAQLAGLDEIPAIVRVMEDAEVASASLIENIQREDLNPLEEAQALARLCDEFGMTHTAVAASIGRSRAAVSNLMRLLDLHDEVKLLVDQGKLDMGHARALLGAPTAEQPLLANRIVGQELTVRAVEKLIRQSEKDRQAAATDEVPDPSTNTDTNATDPDVERLVEKLSGVLGTGVKIHQRKGGAGRLEIPYGSLEELDGILAHIK